LRILIGIFTCNEFKVIRTKKILEQDYPMNEITIRRPDDWHVHLREGAMLNAVLPFTVRQFGRAIIMPNLAVPVTTTALAGEYRRKILEAMQDGSLSTKFIPLMTCYLTDDTSANDIEQGYADGILKAAKLYPANVTTNSAHGVTDIAKLDFVFEKMQEIGMPLLLHGEVTDLEVDIFDREAVYIERVLTSLIEKFPTLKIVMEHVTTKDAIDFVRGNQTQMAATITAHHLMINRNDIFEGGIHPHHYCLPIAKREVHRLALREAVTSGDRCFFLGTDTAPHPIDDKEAACGCAGIFTALNALELYTQVFDEENALDKLEGFASVHGPSFYGMDVNEGTVTLIKKTWRVPGAIVVPDGGSIRPFRAGQTLGWKLKD
jgi:dihydroorotase